MWGIKFWNAEENLRPFNIKKYSLSLVRDENFFLQIWRMGYKKSVFSTDFSNINLFLVKRAAKKVLAKKLFANWKSPREIGFLLRSNVPFRKQDKKMDFWYPVLRFYLFKEKELSSKRRVNVYILWTKCRKCKQPINIRRTVFYKQVLDFHRPSKLLCHTSGRQTNGA